MNLPALPRTTAAVLAVFLLAVAGLAALLIVRGNMQVEHAAGLLVVAILGTLGHLAQGLPAGETPKPPMEAP